MLAVGYSTAGVFRQHGSPRRSIHYDAASDYLLTFTTAKANNTLTHSCRAQPNIILNTCTLHNTGRLAQTRSASLRNHTLYLFYIIDPEPTSRWREFIDRLIRKTILMHRFSWLLSIRISVAVPIDVQWIAKKMHPLHLIVYRFQLRRRRVVYCMSFRQPSLYTSCLRSVGYRAISLGLIPLIYYSSIELSIVSQNVLFVW